MYMRICIPVYVSMYVYVCICKRLCICMYMCLRIYLYMCFRMYICRLVHVNTHLYTINSCQLLRIHSPPSMTTIHTPLRHCEEALRTQSIGVRVTPERVTTKDTPLRTLQSTTYQRDAEPSTRYSTNP